LVWEYAQGKVWLLYNAPEYFNQRHRLHNELLDKILGVGGTDRECGRMI
jgi:hypothetical protein